ncbi:phosphoribosylformylglycinamidine synthase subunit PurS [Geminicoccaceae bacterium 1502E]|nr:phosphoribosylformylglycinamidine synthase subunit PurS [Geminicoccaceae bacterium 1502E]
MKARVEISLRPGVLDPEAQTIERSLASLGFDGVGHVRRLKVIELDLAHRDRAAAEKAVAAMCEQLLANPVIESYSIDIDD